MKKYYPSFYNDFVCLCSECPDTCCAKWEIVVDEKSVETYNNICGEFGEKLRENIVKDADGDYIFKLTDGRCPLLNKDNLCDIHINLGKEYTCEVCKQHPDFIEEFDDFTEVCPSISCPETVNLIFSGDFREITYPEINSCSEDEILQLLIDGRKSAFKIVYSDLSFLQKCEELCLLASEIQSEIDFCECFCNFDFDFISAVQFLLDNTENLTVEWYEILKGIKVQKNCKSDENKLSALLAYYIYRYFLKAVNDCDIITTVKFILFSVLFCEHIRSSAGLSVEEASRLYSKEIEHNTENIDKIKSELKKTP